MNGVLNNLWEWHQNENLFNADNRMKVAGGKTVVLPGLMRNFTYKDVVDPGDIILWHDFKKIVKKWHRVFTKVSVNFCRR